MTNPYDEAVDAWKQNTPKPSSTSGGSPYDTAVNEIVNERQQRTRAIFEKALETNPDQAAEAQKLANTTGLPVDIVERNREEVRRKQQARMLDLARMAQDSPILARQLVDPTFTKQAHDDINNLTNVERTFMGTLGDVGTVALKSAVGLPQALVGLADIPTMGYAGKGVEALGINFKRTQEILSGKEGETLLSYSAAQQAANQRVADVDGFTQTLSTMLENPSTIATMVGESLPQMLGGAAIGRAALSLGARAVGAGMVGPNLPGLMVRQFGEKTAALLASAFGEGTIAAGATAEQLRSENADGLIGAKETLAALGTGAGTALFGFAGGFGARKLGIGDIDTVLVSRGLNAEAAETLKKGFVSSIVRSGISESLFEELPQSIQEQMWQNWANDKPLGQGVGKAAAQGALAGFAMGGGFQAIGRVRDHYSEINTAQTGSQQLLDAINAAAPSALRERNPEQFRTVVQAMADNAEGAPSEIYVDAEVLNQLAPEVLAQLPQSVRDQIPDALAANDVVSISTGDVLTIAPGTPLEQVLVENGRVGDPRAMTKVEANQAAEKAQEFLAQQAQQVIQQAADQQAVQQSHDAVKQTLLDQLNAVGRDRPAVNQNTATLYASLYTTLAGELGITPEAAFGLYGVNIVGQTGQGGVLDQPAPFDLSLPAESNKIREFKVGDTRIVLDANANTGTVKIASVRTPASKRGQGGARAAMQALIQQADREGVTLMLDASALDKKTSTDKLIKFYESLGFAKTGNKVNALGEPEMARSPQQLNQSAILNTIEVDGKTRPTTNSNGQPLAQTEEGVRNFWRWFGDSKVVDADGKPLVVYHGTNQTITAFDPAKIGTRDAGFFGSGFYFTPEEGQALDYADTAVEDTGEGDAVAMPLYVSLQNPFIWDMSDAGADATRAALATFGIKRDSVRGNSAALGNTKERQTFNRAVRAAEFDGVIVRDEDGVQEVVAFESEQIKSATGNRGTFDPADPNILNQGPRGTFNPATFELALNENSNMSTVHHEMAHAYLEIITKIASEPNAPQGIVDQVDRFLKWQGITDLATWNMMTLDQKRPHHEAMAENYEHYLITGKAPSVELQPLFRKFKLYMLNAYRSLKAFLAANPDVDKKLPPEMVQFYDRMLASEEQIAQANEVAGLLPDPDADAEAVEKLTARSLRDLKWAVNARNKEIKRLQDQAKELRKGVEEQVTAEVNAMPEFQAKAALDALQVTPDYTVALNAWKEQRAAALTAAAEQIKADLLAANPDVKGLKKGQLLAKNKRLMANQAEAKALEWEAQNPKPTKAQNATDADLAVVADSFGYPDADTMLQAIDAIGKKSDVIAGMTDQRMLEEHGDLIDQRAIEQAANEAVHNEARARSLATELKSQAEMLNARTDTGQTNAAGSKITVNALLEAAKQFAANVVGRTPIKDLQSKARQHTAAERRAGKRWQDHTTKGETADAVKAKQDQMLNNAAAKAALEAQAEMRKILEFFKRVYKDGNEKTVEKGRDPDVVNAARAILGAYGVAPKGSKTALEYLALVEKNDPAMYAALQPSVQGALNLAQPLEALTMDELRALNEEIQSMWHLAKRSRQMEVDGNLIDIQEAEDELQGRMQVLGVPTEMPGESGALTPREELARKLQFAGSILRRVEQWADGMGKEFTRLVFQPVKEAADRYRADRVNYRKAYQALIDTVAPSLVKGQIVATELGYTFGKGHNGIGHAELLHAILHTGNESNKRKLLLGRGWATENADGTMDTSKWDAFIKRMHDTGVLNKAHYDFAQGVWNLLEQTKPLAQKTHRDVFGRYFAEVTAESFTTPFGTYAGGYVPAQADPRIVQDAALRDLATTENENMAFSFPGTNKGFTKGRVEYNRPLMLDLRTIGQHIDKVLLFSHMEPAVRDVNKLLSRKGVSYSLGRIDPTIYAGMLTPWLNRSARQIVETPIVGDGGISRVLSAARSRAGMALMFANVSNTLQQLTGFSLAALKVKPASMMRATAQFIASPKQTARAVSDASAFMANRMENEISAINDAMDQILLDPNLYQKAQAWTQKHAYFLQTAMANTMEPIIWTAAYNDALAEGQSEKDAVRQADGVIRTTQGSTLPEDVSRIETGPAYARVFTQFIGYFNMMANTNATALKQIAQEEGLKKGAGKALGVVTLGFLVPIWVAEAIAHAMRGGPEDKDDDGYLDDWLAAVFGMGTIKGSLAMVPFVGQLANAGIARFNSNPADDKMSLSPAVSLLESAVGVPVDVYRAITDPEKLNMRNAVRDVASAVSIATGLPAVAIARPLGYLAGVEQGKIEPTSAVDMARGLITGTPSPTSK